MRSRHFLTGVIALGILTIFTADASAMYHPTMGRFLQRDPGSGGMAAAPRLGTAGTADGEGFLPRDEYADGMNLYEYVGSSPIAFTDPSGLRKGPCIVKQISGPGGDGSFSDKHEFKPLERRRHHKVQVGGRTHKVGHTWIACGAGGADPSYGFYPESYAKSGITAIPGVSVPSVVPGLNEAGKQDAHDPMNGPNDDKGKPIIPDCTWPTEVTDEDRDDGRKLLAGPDKDTPCCKATDDQIKNCVKAAAGDFSKRGWSLYNHCQDFTVYVLNQCCMKAGAPQKRQ